MDDQTENKTNLIVNYLPQNMTDEEFENLFKKFGSMKSCKIVRNKLNGFSYGFGFVDFENNEQALRAIDELNGHELDNKKIKVAFARPAGQDIKQANLYIKNIPHEWGQENVRKIFEPYGKIIQVRVLSNNRGVAFVLFDLRKQAEDALEALNGQIVDGCDTPLSIKFAADKKSERGNSKNRNSISNSNNNNNNNNNNNLNRRNRDRGGGNYNSGGGRRMNNNNNNGMNDLGPMRQAPSNKMNRFAPFVPMVTQTSAPMMAPPLNPVTYGYPNQQQLPQQQQQQTMLNPYNMMPTQQMAPMQAPPVLQAPSGAPQMMQPQLGMYGTAQIPVGYATTISQNAMNNIYSVASNNLTNAANMQPQFGQPMASMRNSTSNTTATPGGNDDGVTLFVYNIGPDSDEDELRAIFEPYGQVVKCNVVRKTPGGETKGFGFVTLKDRNQADSAITGLNGSMRNGRALQVSLKK